MPSGLLVLGLGLALGLTVPGTLARGATIGPIVVVVMENHDLAEVQNEPYLSAFAAGGALFTNYFAITHPSLPNYIAMTSGSTGGYTTDAGKARSDHDDNIFNQLDVTRSDTTGWVLYAESMSSNCQFKNVKPYYVRHTTRRPTTRTSTALGSRARRTTFRYRPTRRARPGLLR